jgi:hypothetical protein
VAERSRTFSVERASGSFSALNDENELDNDDDNYLINCRFAPIHCFLLHAQTKTGLIPGLPDGKISYQKTLFGRPSFENF